MKKGLLGLFGIIFSLNSFGQSKDSTINYLLPDSVKAVQFLTELTIKSFNRKKAFALRVISDGASLSMGGRNKNRVFVFRSDAESSDVLRGLNTWNYTPKDLSIGFHYNWKVNETYKLLIAQASDSAARITIYSGYVFLPREGKWKYIGSGRVYPLRPVSLKPTLKIIQGKKQKVDFTNGATWAQRSNGSWKNLKGENLPNPVITLAGHLDSVKQRERDIKIIEEAIASGKTDVKENVQGVYYKILKEGTGNKIGVTDTVSVYYHLHLLNDTATIDEAKNAPARFPLNRLIRGWSIGVPLIKVGGKIRLVIPSDLAYSIRTRSAKIPPNSILVFTIEVLDAKSPD